MFCVAVRFACWGFVWVMGQFHEAHLRSSHHRFLKCCRVQSLSLGLRGVCCALGMLFCRGTCFPMFEFLSIKFMFFVWSDELIFLFSLHVLNVTAFVLQFASGFVVCAVSRFHFGSREPSP